MYDIHIIRYLCLCTCTLCINHITNVVCIKVIGIVKCIKAITRVLQKRVLRLGDILNFIICPCHLLAVDFTVVVGVGSHSQTYIMCTIILKGKCTRLCTRCTKRFSTTVNNKIDTIKRSGPGSGANAL